MPTYIYNCKTCGEYEHHQSIHADTLKICPKCGGRDIVKVVSASVGFVFKGSGFYETDYKRKEKPESCESCEHGKGCPHSKN